MSGRQRSNSRLEADAMALTADLIARLGQCPPEPGWSPADQKFEDEDYRQMLQALMTARPADQLWLFAYGSLMWRPACPDCERRPARLRGYHRRFCLWMRRYRGTPERPGLMLALDHGGECRGLAMRLDHSDAERHIEQVLRRELVLKPPAYRPRWLSLETEQGPITALGFVIDRRSPRYTGALADSKVAEVLAGAIGHAGTGAEYLLRTVLELEQIGCRDRRLWRLQAMVAEHLAALPASG